MKITSNLKHESVSDSEPKTSFRTSYSPRAFWLPTSRPLPPSPSPSCHLESGVRGSERGGNLVCHVWPGLRRNIVPALAI